MFPFTNFNKIWYTNIGPVTIQYYEKKSEVWNGLEEKGMHYRCITLK